MNIGITGASGMIGQGLGALALASGHEVIGYSRSATSGKSLSVTRSMISSPNQRLPETKLDALVHLAGESLLGLWTVAKQERIWKSRVELTKKIVAELGTWQPVNRPSVLLCASGIGFYGDRGDEILEENSTVGHGFLADLCREWEAAAREASDLGIRVVLLRTGVVLGKHGGAFPLMKTAFSFGFGGNLGSGKQWMSWIHEQDQVSLILWAIENARVAGPMNLCAPHPVRNADLTRQLAAQLKRPAFLHVPAFALRWAARGLAQEMLLGSQRAYPRLAIDLGYHFAQSDLTQALADLTKS